MERDGSESAEKWTSLDLVQRRCTLCGKLSRFREGSEQPVCSDCARADTYEKFRRGIAERRLRIAGLLDGEPAHMHLDTFVRDKPFQLRAWTVVTTWLSDWGAHMQAEPLEGFRDSVLLWSKTPGTGKTHLARAVQRHLICRGAVAIFEPMSALLDKIRQSYDDPELSTSAIMARLKDADLLILDDLGKEYVSERARGWLENILWNVIDHRDTHHKPMVVTSNLLPAAIADVFGAYGASRFSQMVGPRIVDMTGPDWRMG